MAENTGYVYYYSNSEKVDEHCLEFVSPVELKELPWRMHKEKPDESLVDPVWSNDAQGWIDFSAQTLPQQLSVVQAENKEIKKSIETYQKAAEENTKQNTAVQGAIEDMQKSNAQMLQMMTQMMMGGASMPTAPTAPTTSSDEKKED